MEFKIGDKVLVKYGKSSSSRELAGKICTIEKAYPLFCVLEEEEGNDIYEKGGVWNEDIELYEEEFPEKWCLEITKESFPFIQKTYSDFEDFKEHTQFSNRYLKSDHFYGHRSIKEPSEEYPEITLDQFKKHILKESTIMKNLLETEFVIENCTLSQRLAIKAYCDEKKIKYVGLEVPSYKTLTFSEGKFKGFINSVVQRDVITFSELIQFLDKYQPEPEFKVGDKVYIIETSLGWIERGDIVELGGKYWENYGIKKENEKNHFSCKTIENPGGNSGLGITKFRHATPEEIKKWKEENEIKLPEINGFKGKANKEFIVYGDNCAKLKISWFKNIGDVSSFLNIGENRTIRSIKLNSDVEITIAHIEQIKKFIEHNKL